MQVQLFDRVTLDAASVRLTADGYLVAEARSARTGIQEYRAGELGLTDRDARDVIRVYRPAEEVFADEAMRSMAYRPVTMDHPSKPVTADNWKELSVGNVGGEVVRDGEFVRVPLVLMDAGAIKAVQGKSKRELSWGYSSELTFEAGITDSGEPYDARMSEIRCNHLAVVDRARGGPSLKIGDRRETTQPNDGDGKMPHTLIIDGLQVPNVSDEAKAAIEKLQGQITSLAAAKDAAETQVGTLTATVQTKDGEIAGLTAKLADAEVTPAKLQQLADARAKVITDAKKIAGDALVVDGKTDVEIRRAAVAAKLGDKAADMTDAAVEGAFAALAAASPAAPVTDAARTAIATGVVNVGDANKALVDAKAARLDRYATGYQRQPEAA